SSAYGGPTPWRPSLWFPSLRKKESKDCRAKPVTNAPDSDLGHYLEHSSQALPCNPSIPSFAMMGTIMRAATGSAHHRPRKIGRASCRKECKMGRTKKLEKKK